MPDPSYSEQWLWESSDYPLCTSLRRYTLPAPRFGTVGNTSDTSGDAHTV